MKDDKPFLGDDGLPDFSKLIMDLFSTMPPAVSSAEDWSAFCDESLRKMASCSVGRQLTLEEAKFQSKMTFAQSIVDKLVDFIELDLPYKANDFIPEIFKTMRSCKDELVPLFRDVSTKIEAELLARNLRPLTGNKDMDK